VGVILLWVWVFQGLRVKKLSCLFLRLLPILRDFLETFEKSR
jgi:hypothetical protein